MRGHFFGDTTMLSRSLSGLGETTFDVQLLEPPRDESDAEQLSLIKRALHQDQVLALFVEPLRCRSMERMDVGCLSRIREFCSTAGVPLIYHESAAMFYRFSNRAFSASGLPGIEPDGVVASLGGQAALAGLREEWFVADPLKLISTWDGDGLSLAKFAAAARAVQRDETAHLSLMATFTDVLKERLRALPATRAQVERGAGWIEGALPTNLEPMFDRGIDGRWLVCPSPAQMRRFVRHSESSGLSAANG
jgi:acetylornithine/succinyldiaminopimelate/putrescine aminotransferase